MLSGISRSALPKDTFRGSRSPPNELLNLMMPWIDCAIVPGKPRGHNRKAAILDTTTPVIPIPAHRHCRAANNTTPRTTNCGFTRTAKITVMVARPHRCRDNATK
ncbi:Uncharacterised protein [Mycobacterium tuberculosis]|uniref:Uncharacterized protein n=1 Tax=Mycobacterium tuberculosis TaxID=1773 RepID=A0A916LD99_MYCTX|nr:Uncharacterised protein [Mycobacterium tuberculosis]COY11889.1 Uncharacterised protein [Mycobacterium tuberculosis]COZ19617.1 Uncharacterised protein [Mycobacterium tuberculosis]